MPSIAPCANIDVPIIESGDEYPVRPKIDSTRIPKPLLSLSQGTTETLTHISPSPSPSPPQSDLPSQDSRGPPTLLPATGCKISRDSATTATQTRSSPKRPFKPPGRMSPTKDMTALPPLVSAADIYAPPKAMVKGQRSKIAKTLRAPRRPGPGASDDAADNYRTSSPRFSSHTEKIKQSHATYSPVSTTKVARPPLSNLFIHPDALEKTIEKRGTSLLSNPTPALAPTALVQRRMESPSKTSPVPNSASDGREQPVVRGIKPTRSLVEPVARPASHGPEQHVVREPKAIQSSVELRQKIAKAKHDKKKQTEAGGAPNTAKPTCGLAWATTSADSVLQSLRNRINKAVTSGRLDISGMALTSVPREVLTMYDTDSSSVSWSEMVDLTHFDAADNEISTLQDALFPDVGGDGPTDDEQHDHQFGGVEHINLCRNRLTCVPVGFCRLSRLQTLKLTGNKLTADIFDTLSRLPAIRGLILRDNLIRGVLQFDVGTLSCLETLELGGNGIVAIHPQTLAALTGLKRFDVSKNEIAALPWDVLATLPLTELDVSTNHLSRNLFSDIPAPFAELRTLDLSHNDLEDISALGVITPALKSLALDGNRLATLPDLTRCSQLQTLTAAQNQLTDLPLHFADLSKLRMANFAHNCIRVIPAEIGRMTHLTNLELVGNPLRHKKQLSMNIEDLKQHLLNLIATSQDSPDLSVEVKLPAVKPQTAASFVAVDGTLDLSSQGLATISLGDIDLSQPIRNVKLFNNDLTHFPTDLLTHPLLAASLQSLDLSHNPCLHPTDYLSSTISLPSLKSLYIVSTGMASLDALTSHLRAPELTELNISCNRLTGRVPTARNWWPKCTTLLATDNWFNSVDVEDIRGLEVLDIRNNEIGSLPAQIGLLGNMPGNAKVAGRLRLLEASGNTFRVPRPAVVEKGTEAILSDLRRMVPAEQVPVEWEAVI